MRQLLAISVLAAACSLGCEKKSGPKMEGDRPGVEIKAPGVDVKIEPKQGVDVKAPGVDVEASRSEGKAEVKVNAPQ